MEEDLLRRAADLAERCERTATVTSTAFLTPAEQYALTNWARHRDCTLVLHGGGAGCERRAAFFLPFYLAAEDFDPAEHLCAVHFSAPFGAPGHRDFLGAILGLGIRREWVGDILVQEHGAYLYEGEGLYLLNDDWVPVKAEDFIWMGAYCKQCCYGVGLTRLSYIYSKDCHRAAEI